MGYYEINEYERRYKMNVTMKVSKILDALKEIYVETLLGLEAEECEKDKHLERIKGLLEKVTIL